MNVRRLTSMAILGVATACVPSAPAPAPASAACDERVPAIVEATLAMDLERTSWTTAIAVQGLAAAADCPGVTPELAPRLAAWATARVGEAGPPNSVNFGAVGGALLVADRAVDSGNDEPDVRAFALDIADYLLDTHPRTEPAGPLVHSGDQLWIDTTFMVAALDLAATDLTGDARYLDDAIVQILEHAERMQDEASGLFFHGWDFSDAGAGLPHAAAAHWARGNGWVALALATVLEDLPVEHPSRAALVEILDELLTALAEHQTESGLWRTIVDDPQAYEESSASAAITRSFEIAVELELLDPSARAVVEAAHAGLGSKLEDGRLLGVSASTSLLPDPQAYLEIAVGPPQPWGQGLMLLLLAR